MNCLYCDSELIRENKRKLVCIKCPVRVAYFTYGWPLVNDIPVHYVEFYLENGYRIEFDLEHKLTEIYHKDITTFGMGIPFNYLVDVTPANAEAWLNRILSLKAFI